MQRIVWVLIVCIFSNFLFAQERGLNWTADGMIMSVKNGNIVKTDPKTDQETIVIKKEAITPPDGRTLRIQSFSFSNDKTKVLLFTNTAKVWRYNTRGDYWVYNTLTAKLQQTGKGLPSQSLMFAKFSPDGRNVAYVSEHNIYTEDITMGNPRRLTNDGTRKMINGTFDWVYEEEFGCRDGFRWSPDSKQIAYWQVNATKIRDYYMLNTTDSIYSRVIPVEYPKVGEAPSPVRIGVINLSNGYTRWMNIDGDPQQHYLPRMEWSSSSELIVQQLDRKQQESRLIYCNAYDGNSKTFWAENDDAWVDLNADDPSGWNWINKGQDFLWISEKDGWRHIYKISRDGKSVTLLTKGNYDIKNLKAIDETNNWLYFLASPNNATQMYLYRVRLNNAAKTAKEEPELVSNALLKGTHQYDIAPNGKIAFHSFSNYNTYPVSEYVTLPEHKAVNNAKSIAAQIKTDPNMNVEYIQVQTDDKVMLDAWIRKPSNFDPNKKYPVVFYVYGEPAAATVGDEYGNHENFLYNGDMAADGYIQVAIDNRGTPSLKGAAWRKAIYRKIGDINIRDMAAGAKKILERSYMDKSRVAVWGWSGGGSSTLNLLFRYPEIFQTGVSIAAVASQLNYDNIYQERYMGLPQENREDFVKNSPINYVSGLKGNLLYIHGTGDDNVHYSNAEMLINALIANKKQFELMSYPNRTHSISEGAGTREHLSMLYTNFIKKNCAPGGR